MKLEINELIMKYAIGFPKRYTRKQKDIFLNEIGEDFMLCGYKVRGAADKKKGKASVNLHVGDVAHAENIIVVNYDTPQHNFGNPMKYYPFNGAATFSSSFLPIYTPAIIGGIITLWLVIQFLPNLDFNNEFIVSALLVLALIIVMALSFILTKGVANKTNFNYNTSGVVTALKLASILSEKERKNTAFVLTDNGCNTHSGDYMLREALPKTIDKRRIILVSNVGDGEEFVIGYKEDTKTDAINLANCFEKKPKRKLCNKEELRYTSFSFYKRSMLISKGTFKDKGFVVDNVSTNKDVNCDVVGINLLVKALKQYLT